MNYLRNFSIFYRSHSTILIHKPVYIGKITRFGVFEIGGKTTRLLSQLVDIKLWKTSSPIKFCFWCCWENRKITNNYPDQTVYKTDYMQNLCKKNFLKTVDISNRKNHNYQLLFTEYTCRVSSRSLEWEVWSIVVIWVRENPCFFPSTARQNRITDCYSPVVSSSWTSARRSVSFMRLVS